MCGPLPLPAKNRSPWRSFGTLPQCCNYRREIIILRWNSKFDRDHYVLFSFGSPVPIIAIRMFNNNIACASLPFPNECKVLFCDSFTKQDECPMYPNACKLIITSLVNKNTREYPNMLTHPFCTGRICRSAFDWCQYIVFPLL